MDSYVERLLQEYQEDFCLEDFSREKLICQLLKYDMGGSIAKIVPTISE